MFAAETVERYVFESYTALARTAKINTYLPSTTEHFANDRLNALAKSKGAVASEVPEVLFVCVQNAGRSQMAAALLTVEAKGRIHVRSAGSLPAAELDPAVVAAMSEMGLDLTKDYPKPLTDDVVRASDVVITMGCGDSCPIYPGKRYEDWELADPAGLPVAAVRIIRDEIHDRVKALAPHCSTTPPQTRKNQTHDPDHENAQRPVRLQQERRKIPARRRTDEPARRRDRHGALRRDQTRHVAEPPVRGVAGRTRHRHHRRTPQARHRRRPGRGRRRDRPGHRGEGRSPRGQTLEVWDTDEPSERGIEGMERMRLVRDDIKARVQKLYAELTGADRAVQLPERASGRGHENGAEPDTPLGGRPL